ncbi:hypothetical protein vBAbaMD22_138 [Acinetobacter phage vB_AbaM_D22]|nr:hypothetical protein vBAbaMD22_138 [Acinetobacter phage vB_AbaM_D22]
MDLEVEVLRKYDPVTGLILYSDFMQGQFIQGYMGDIAYIIMLWDVNGVPKAYKLK